MTWQFNIYAVPLYAIAVLLMLMLVYAWRHRANRTVRLFMLMMMMSISLVVAYANELMSADLRSIMLWLPIEYFSQGVLVLLLLFSLSYAGYDRWVTPHLGLLLFIPVISVAVLVATNDQHGLIWRYAGVAEVNGLVMFDRSYGPVFWVWFAYLTGLLLMASFFLVRRAVLATDMYRWQVGLILTGAALPWIFSVLTVMGLTPIPYIDLEPYGIGLMALPVGLSLLHFHLLDIVPVAHSMVFKTIQDALIVCNHRLRVVDVNPAARELLDLPPRLSLGRPVVTLLPGLPMLDGTLPIAAEMVLFDESSCSQRTYDLQAVPLAAARGTGSGWLLVLRDITARKEADRRAFELRMERERVKLLEEVIENMSHDFRTPITVIATSNYLICKLTENGQALNGSDPPASAQAPGLFARIQEKSTTIEQSTERLSRMFDDLLDVLSLEQAPPFDLQPENLNTIAQEQVSFHQSRGAQKALTYHLDLAPQVLPTNLQHTYFSRAVDSLLDNAFHYTPAGGEITVRTGLDAVNCLVWIEVQDTGPGIAPDDLPHIFKHFYRADKARSVDTGGAGVGLSIARMIVDRHGGQISVTSTPDAGSAFRIDLPITDLPPQT